MLDINDFSQKQIVVFAPYRGDKLSYRNDNMIITDADNKIKYQLSCYRIFIILIIGDCTITTGLIRRAGKFGFSICLMTYSFRFYKVISFGMEGNNYLHSKQYKYSGTDLGRIIIRNKIQNQKSVLNLIRKRSDYINEGIVIIEDYLKRIDELTSIERDVLLGIEGNAAKVYFSRLYEFMNWNGRKPRVKNDYINCLLDIGYTLLFNFLDCILHVFDFDVYQGVLHTNFYMRKSLVCDLMEPFRPLIDWRVRKGINLGQFKKDDFIIIKNQCQLEYKKSSEYTWIFMNDILDNKESIFLYVRTYYRAFMKEKKASEFPVFDISADKVIFADEMG